MRRCSALAAAALGIAVGTLACAQAVPASGQQIYLWPGTAPGSEGETGSEVVQDADQVKNFKRISNVHKPSLLVFLPPKEKATGVGLIVAPGGGHQFLVIEKEGLEVADWLNQHGIAAFVLKYRLARSEGSHYTVEGNALPDANRAVRMVRAHAAEWGVDPKRIGFMGFSAGGEVAALAETRFDNGNAQAADPIDRAPSRPDFAIVVYPGFKPGSVTVPANAPRTFLVCADDDRSHVTATVELYLGLEKQHVPAEMHIYATGGHGFALRDVHAPVSSWNARLLEWLRDQKILTS